MKTTLQKTLSAAINAVERLKSILNKDLEKTLGRIAKRQGKIVTIGIGKSSFVAGKLAATLTSLGNPAFFLHPSDALHGDSGIVEDGDVLIAFSYSGESIEVVKLCKYLVSHYDIVLVTVSGNKNSTLGKISDENIEIKVKEEGCPMNCAPMASVTASLVVADLIASGLVDPEFSHSHFAKLHPGGKLGMTLKKVSELMSEAPLIGDGNIFEAIEKINKYKKGIVGIIKNKKLVGVLTDGDIRRLFGKDGNEKVRYHMSKNPKVIDHSENLLTALQKMENNKITSLFVLKNKSVVGIIHMHDIIQAHVT